MEHEHILHDADPHFNVNASMEIKCPGTVKALKQGDHASEIYSFSMPRFVEGHDMALCDTVEVHYINQHYDRSTKTTTENRSFDEVENFRKNSSEDMVTWQWRVKRDATRLDGTLSFCVRFACTENSEVVYQKFTEIYSNIPVNKTIHNSDTIASEYADVLLKWKSEIFEAIKNSTGSEFDEKEFDERFENVKTELEEFFASYIDDRISSSVETEFVVEF